MARDLTPSSRKVIYIFVWVECDPDLGVKGLRQGMAKFDFRMTSRLWMAISQRLEKLFENFQKFIFSKKFNLNAGFDRFGKQV